MTNASGAGRISRAIRPHWAAYRDPLPVRQQRPRQRSRRRASRESWRAAAVAARPVRSLAFSIG